MSAPPVIRGIDVSHHQGGGILWSQVRASGVRFAYLKATEGAAFKDSQFAHNRAGCAAASVLVGAYHFYKYDTDWGPQATNFLTAVGTRHKGELPPCLDLEDREGIEKLGIVVATRKTLAWLETMESKLGCTPVIYADRDFIAAYLTDKGFAKYPLWLAAYTKTKPKAPAPWKAITFWQNAEHGTVPGVYGDCDLDQFLGDDAALQRLAS